MNLLASVLASIFSTLANSPLDSKSTSITAASLALFLRFLFLRKHNRHKSSKADPGASRADDRTASTFSAFDLSARSASSASPKCSNGG